MPAIVRPPAISTTSTNFSTVNWGDTPRIRGCDVVRDVVGELIRSVRGREVDEEQADGTHADEREPAALLTGAVVVYGRATD